ncbi:hypothetical protein O3P69_012222 [Scylla paramamosain]|uniref:Uncharacterized protein n=1 Tax=Scylla paramamosain TaxID=85552 RepID=A0AAW0TF27_SCYPA
MCRQVGTKVRVWARRDTAWGRGGEDVHRVLAGRGGAGRGGAGGAVGRAWCDAPRLLPLTHARVPAPPHTHTRRGSVPPAPCRGRWVVVLFTFRSPPLTAPPPPPPPLHIRGKKSVLQFLMLRQ